MISEFSAAIQSVKVLGDILKATRELKNSNEYIAAVSEIYEKLLTAQVAASTSLEKMSALNKTVSKLEKEIAELKDWRTEADRYQLTELCPDVTIFTPKPGMENNEPPHKLCTACYGKRQKGYLQRTDLSSQGTHYKCDSCASEVLDHSTKRVFPTQKRPDTSAFR